MMVEPLARVMDEHEHRQELTSEIVLEPIEQLSLQEEPDDLYEPKVPTRFDPAVEPSVRTEHMLEKPFDPVRFGADGIRLCERDPRPKTQTSVVQSVAAESVCKESAGKEVSVAEIGAQPEQESQKSRGTDLREVSVP